MARGFSILEMIIAMGVIAVISGVLLVNFRSTSTSATARLQTARAVIADIRLAQARATTGYNYAGLSACGYGVHYVDSTTYALYAGAPSAGGGTCVTASRVYDNDTDVIVETKKIVNSTTMRIGTPFPDIFFESPDPQTYIGESKMPTELATILIERADFPSEVTTVTVKTSGAIDVY